MSEHCKYQVLPRATPLQFNKTLGSTPSKSGRVLILKFKKNPGNINHTRAGKRLCGSSNN